MFLDAYPWQISLQVTSLLGQSHICGGSIINENYVVCAAHCVQGQNKNKLRVKITIIGFQTALGAVHKLSDANRGGGKYLSHKL